MKAAPLLALLLLAPLALADQSVSTGPAQATTTSSDVGDACGGANGFHERDARLVVSPDGRNVIVVELAQGCYDSSSGAPYYFEGHGNQTYAGVTRTGPNPGDGATLAAFSWTTWHAGSPYVGYQSSCDSRLDVLSVRPDLGCPTPDGSAAPMLPVLP